MEDTKDLLSLHQDFFDTYDWPVGEQLISVSRSIAHGVFRNIDQSSAIFMPFVNHYPRFFNLSSIPAPLHFDTSLHIQVLHHLLVKSDSKAQPALLAFLAEVGLKIGFEIETLRFGAEGHQIMPCQPRLIHLVRQIPQISDSPMCKEAPPGMWYACRMSGCQKLYIRRTSIEKHLTEDHKFSHTEVFEVFNDPANAGEQLQKRFGPFFPQELEPIGFDITTLQLQRIPKRKRSQWEAVGR